MIRRAWPKNTPDIEGDSSKGQYLPNCAANSASRLSLRGLTWGATLQAEESMYPLPGLPILILSLTARSKASPSNYISEGLSPLRSVVSN